MTEENKLDQPVTEGAPVAKKGSTASKSLAASTQMPLGIEIPSPTTSVRKELEYVWEAAGDGLVFTEEDLLDAVGHDPKRTLRRTNARQPSAWGQAPGTFAVLVEGTKILRGAAKVSKRPMNLEYLVVKALPDQEMVLVSPATEKTPGAIETRREGKGPLIFTITDILRAAGMEITPGYRELYPVKKVAKSPIGPGIAILMEKSLESKKIGKKKEDEVEFDDDEVEEE